MTMILYDISAVKQLIPAVLQAVSLEMGTKVLLTSSEKKNVMASAVMENNHGAFSLK